MQLGIDWIQTHLPHQGSMCLLNQVLSWNADSICCQATSHRLSSNPLRYHNQLGAACGIEYAAQAIALHGALLTPEGATSRVGYLTSVRSVETWVKRLDDLDLPLTIKAERQGGDARMVIYSFSVLAGQRLLQSGRASVILDALEPGTTPTP